MIEGPEKRQFVVTRYFCTNCKYFKRSTPDIRFPDFIVTDCIHPIYNGPFPGRSLGQKDTTPDWCPYLKGEQH